MDLEVASQYAEIFGLLTIIGAINFSWYQIPQQKFVEYKHQYKMRYLAVNMCLMFYLIISLNELSLLLLI